MGRSKTRGSFGSFATDMTSTSVPNGPGGAWFRGLQARHAGHVSAGAVDADVLFEDADHGLDDEIDEEYRRKYGSSTAVDRITSPDARSTTVRFVRT